MKICKIIVTTDFEKALGDACLAPAFVGIDNFSTGTPVINVVIPKKNMYGENFAAIKRAIREHALILRLFPQTRASRSHFGWTRAKLSLTGYGQKSARWPRRPRGSGSA